jgi:hypothetical protein
VSLSLDCHAASGADKCFVMICRRLTDLSVMCTATSQLSCSAQCLATSARAAAPSHICCKCRIPVGRGVISCSGRCTAAGDWGSRRRRRGSSRRDGCTAALAGAPAELVGCAWSRQSPGPCRCRGSSRGPSWLRPTCSYFSVDSWFKAFAERHLPAAFTSACMCRRVDTIHRTCSACGGTHTSYASRCACECSAVAGTLQLPTPKTSFAIQVVTLVNRLTMSLSFHCGRRSPMAPPLHLSWAAYIGAQPC